MEKFKDAKRHPLAAAVKFVTTVEFLSQVNEVFTHDSLQYKLQKFPYTFFCKISGKN